jgi:uracil-DNA glycosylase family 4
MSEKSRSPYETYKKCNACFPLKGRAITIPHGPENADIMIIGQGPSRRKNLQSPRDCLERSESAKLLLECLRHRDVCIDPSKIYFTNLVKCTSFVSGEGEHNGEGFGAKCYNRFLKDEIERIKPKRIVVLGNRPWDFLEKSGKIDERFHKVTHPSYFLGGKAKSARLREPRTRDDYRAELRKACGVQASRSLFRISHLAR